MLSEALCVPCGERLFLTILYNLTPLAGNFSR